MKDKVVSLIVGSPAWKEAMKNCNDVVNYVPNCKRLTPKLSEELKKITKEEICKKRS